MWDWYERPKPRRPANGIRAKSQRGRFGQTWWAQQWIAALESFGWEWESRLQRGRSYARAGQVVSIEVHKGRVVAWVQGSMPRPYKVVIEFPTLSDAHWQKVIKAMAGQAIFAAKLLAGEMPPGIEEAFRSARVPLFPRGAVDFEAVCNCLDFANPCKHIAAVCYLLGEQFDEDPFVLFELRGRTKDEIMEALRLRRATAAQAATPAAEATIEAVDHAPALAEALAAFYSPAEDLKFIVPRIEEPEIEAPLLWLLGKPPAIAEGQLRDLYDEVGRYAIEAVLGESPT